MKLCNKHYTLVKALLQSDPRLRESDRLLMARVWYNELLNSGFAPTEFSASKFLSHLAMGDILSYESITRARRKVMENHPELRGSSYVARQINAETIKKDIKDWRVE